jgi:hypothetical protein
MIPVGRARTADDVVEIPAGGLVGDCGATGLIKGLSSSRGTLAFCRITPVPNLRTYHGTSQ